MKSTVITTLTLLTLAASSLAAHSWNKRLHVTKECSQNTGLPGTFCTITSSNFAAIKVGSKIIYTQASGIPAGMLDSNVILDAGAGNRAVGRCTLDFTTGQGLCVFTDGMGAFKNFEARIDVSYQGGPNFGWDGTYGFDKDDH